MTSATSPAHYLQRMPKTDLHCHLLGTVRATTFADLARRCGLDLPAGPEVIFRDINSLPPNPKLYEQTRIPVPRGRAADEPEVSYSLFQVSHWIAEALRDADDLTRITYEAFEAAHRTSSVRHLEVSFDGLPPHLGSLGYRGAVDAYAEGIRLAERDFGMSGRLIAAVDRSTSAEQALARVRQVVDNPHEYVAGIGLDNLETAGPRNGSPTPTGWPARRDCAAPRTPPSTRRSPTTPSPVSTYSAATASTTATTSWRTTTWWRGAGTSVSPSSSPSPPPAAPGGPGAGRPSPR